MSNVDVLSDGNSLHAPEHQKRKTGRFAWLRQWLWPVDPTGSLSEQFYQTLHVERVFAGLDTIAERRKAAEHEIERILGSEPDWVSAYRAEQLLVGTWGTGKLLMEMERRLADAEELRLASAPIYRARFERLKLADDPVIAEDSPQAQDLFRLLLRLVNDLQWGHVKVFLRRELARAYTRRLNATFCASAAFLLLLIHFVPFVTMPGCTGSLERCERSVAVAQPSDERVGVAQAATAGAGRLAVQGAGLPSGLSGMLAAGEAEAQLDPAGEGAGGAAAAGADKVAIVELGGPFIIEGLSGFWLAIFAGIFGASFMMVTRAQSRINGATLDDLRNLCEVRFILLRLAFGAGAALIVYFAFNAQLLDGVLFPELNKIGFVRVDMEQSDAEQGLGVFVPNKALAGLMVWAFVAGFSETLVPSFLDRVEKSAAKSG